ncbi:MAG: hypothetical protein BWX80_03451 [Candidatus Hydrogenedentes bacterium ADurb.Bin101]|nr:MAG: hypothetical protein BWX80_03451 [Candidatus Hydrogenedentes bacterium ADurb.Bin101]
MFPYFRARRIVVKINTGTGIFRQMYPALNIGYRYRVQQSQNFRGDDASAGHEKKPFHAPGQHALYTTVEFGRFVSHVACNEFIPGFTDIVLRALQQLVIIMAVAAQHNETYDSGPGFFQGTCQRIGHISHAFGFRPYALNRRLAVILHSRHIVQDRADGGGRNARCFRDGGQGRRFFGARIGGLSHYGATPAAIPRARCLKRVAGNPHCVPLLQGRRTPQCRAG